MPTRVGRCFCRALAARFLAAAALVAAAGLAAAHSIVVYSSVRDHAVRAHTPTTVAVRFNAAIEPAFIEVRLINAKGEERRLGPARSSQQGEVRVDLPALPAGAYALRYRVLSTDGHLTDEFVRFSVPEDR